MDVDLDHNSVRDLPATKSLRPGVALPCGAAFLRARPGNLHARLGQVVPGQRERRGPTLRAGTARRSRFQSMSSRVSRGDLAATQPLGHSSSMAESRLPATVPRSPPRAQLTSS